MDVSDLVLGGQPVAVFEALHSRLGRSPPGARSPNMPPGSARKSTREDPPSPKPAKRVWRSCLSRS